MSLRIQTNIASLNAQRSLAGATEALGSSYRRLSTGLRITTAADDAAGLAISERLRARIRSTQQAERNANDGISLTQTAEGALNEVNSILVRMRELAIQASNDTLGPQDKDTVNQEFQQVITEIDRIALGTEFSGFSLLDGSNTTVSLHVGAGTTSGVDTLDITLDSVRASDLGIDTLSVGSTGNTQAAIDAIDVAINSISQIRGRFGATENRLASTINQLRIGAENLSAAESRIRDLDVAEETATLTKNSILQQAAISILAQANVQPQAALSLLG
ncbi:MAG: flagellin [Planctomycetota bacterium]